MDFRILALCAAALAASPPALAEPTEAVKEELRESRPEGFPTQPLELVVAYAAGGGMDVTARILAKYLEQYIDHSVVVSNRTGGGGLIGNTYLALQAPKDGQTIGVVANSMWTDGFVRSEGQWSHENFDALAFIASDPLGWVASPNGSLAGMSLQQIVDEAKASPGTIRIGIVPGARAEYLLEKVERATGAEFLRVPFQGGAPSVAAVVGGHVEIGIGYLGEYRGFLDAGQATVLALGAAERSPLLPDVPTFNEALGVEGVVEQAWRYVAVPEGVPEDRKAWLAAAFNATLDDPELAEEYAELGAIVDRNIDTPEAVEAAVVSGAGEERDFLESLGQIQ